MLISYKHKFIFIHNYKVAGTSIKYALKKHAFNSPLRYDNFNRIIESSEILKLVNRGLAAKISFLPSYTPHGRANLLKKEVPRSLWDSFFKFGFVRNPWDWQVSLFHYMKQLPTHYQHNHVKNIDSFEDYLYWRVTKDLHLQKEYFYDEDGKSLVDFIGKYEDLNEDFTAICEKIGISIKLPHVNKSKHRDYQDYYTVTTQKLVEENFKEDIELFEYRF